MREIEIIGTDSVDILISLNKKLGAKVTDQWGEYVSEFDNEIGKGLIRAFSFDWGVSLIDFDVFFNEEVKINFNVKEINPIAFIFVTEGLLTYQTDQNTKTSTICCFQNTIIASDKNSRQSFIFPKEEKVKANFIFIIKKEYAQKRNNNLSFLSPGLYEAFASDEIDNPFKHYGNFNLKIADQIKLLNTNSDAGIVRSLTIEGQLNLILAMQILEHHNHEKREALPESISKEDIKKIHTLTSYIIDNISEPLHVNTLALQVGMNVKKLQSGFRVLFSKSVNEYVRELKLEVARDLIRNSEYSISEIVYQIGLKSRSYFSKIFSEKYGILPTDYRKMNKNPDENTNGEQDQ